MYLSATLCLFLVPKKHVNAIYKLGINAALSAVHSFTYLGVEITCDLRWNNHVATVVKKASNTLNFVRRNLYRCNGHVKELSYIYLLCDHSWNMPLLLGIPILLAISRTSKWYSVELPAMLNVIINEPLA